MIVNAHARRALQHDARLLSGKTKKNKVEYVCSKHLKKIDFFLYRRIFD